jgi:hypothetical protein
VFLFRTFITTFEDNKKRKIQLQKISVKQEESESSGNDTAYYLKVESEMKKKKELSMNERFRDGYIKGLEAISSSLTKKRGTKLEHKVHQRIGRLKQKYPSIHKHYHIDYKVEEHAATKKQPAKRIVTRMEWKLKENLDMDTSCGIYFLQTSMNDETKILWDSYNIIREVENTFRVLKTDLDLRPIFHKKDDSTMAHLHLALLAYHIVNTIRFQLKKEGINYCWNEIIRIMNTHKAVTTTAQNNCDRIIQIRRCTEPDENVKKIYQALKYKSEPFKMKKVVVHKSEVKNVETVYLRTFNSG